MYRGLEVGPWLIFVCLFVFLLRQAPYVTRILATTQCPHAELIVQRILEKGKPKLHYTELPVQVPEHEDVVVAKFACRFLGFRSFCTTFSVFV